MLVVSASLGYGDLAQRRAQDNAFASGVLDKPKLWLFGSDEALNG